MPAATAYTVLPDRTVVIGSSASNADMVEAFRVAARGRRVVRLHAVEGIDTLHRVAALAAGYGWHPSLSWPSWGVVDIVDMHLGGGL